MSIQIAGAKLGVLTGGPTSIALGDLIDVNLVDVQNSQFLKYDSGTLMWINGDISGSLISTDGVTLGIVDNLTEIGLGDITPDSIITPGTVISPNFLGSTTDSTVNVGFGFTNGSGLGPRIIAWGNTTPEPTASPGALDFYTTAARRLRIDAAGSFIMSAPTTGEHNIQGAVSFGANIGVNGNVTANNFLLPAGDASAGTFGILGGLGSSMVTWGNVSAGGGRLDLYTGAGIAAMFRNSVTPSANFFSFDQAISGQPANMFVDGTDTDVHLQVFTKGIGNISFLSGLGSSPNLLLQGTAGSDNYVVVKGSAGGDAEIFSVQRSLNVVSPIIYTTFSRPPNPTVDHTFNYNRALGHWTQDAPVDARRHEFYKDAAGFNGLFISDDGLAAAGWLTVTGSSAAATAIGLTSIAGVSITSTNSTQGLGITDVGVNGANIRLSGPGAVGNKYLRANADVFQMLNSAYSAVIFQVTDSGVISGVNGEVGWRDLPGNVPVTDGYQLTLDDRGKCITIFTPVSNVIVSDATGFPRGAVVTLFNANAGNAVISPVGGMVMRLAGTATTGARTLAGFGIANIYFDTAGHCIVGGPGVT